ncbi:MAG: septal ring lytic transglycosylase RlpA family protein [Hyphomicrobium sp.]|nr:septal ring lytic transglycosylase RlpA family protein [Hyphomicrobium sp.]
MAPAPPASGSLVVRTPISTPPSLFPPKPAALAVILAVAILGACSSGGPDPKWGVSSSPRVYGPKDPIPKGGGTYKLGKPYVIGGRWYTPREQPGLDEVGIASWYGDDFHGRKTANGEIYDMRRLTAAHPTLPLPTYVYVTNLENGRTVLLRVNDRGPYVGNRVIDLSRAAAEALGTKGRGLGRVRVRYAGHAPMNGDDRRERQFLASQPWYGGRRIADNALSYAPPAAPARSSAASPSWSVMDYRRSALGNAP